MKTAGVRPTTSPQTPNISIGNFSLRKVLVTGSAGFIGYHLSAHLLDEGFAVVGIDGMTDYYDVELKRRRHAMLLQNQNFRGVEERLEQAEFVMDLVATEKPDIIVHLAAQAGVLYSLEDPRSYINSNVIGTFNVMEAAREHKVEHLMMASTSSVYGANESMPFAEVDKCDTPLTIYSATKAANEAMGHSYAHLWDLPTTMFRFFTVYGPWGRPDLALFKFVRAALAGETINVYGYGKMHRDFTHVSDLVRGIRLLIDAAPVRPEKPEDIPEGDSLSPVAPYRIVNIGNSAPVLLTDFVDAIEEALDMKIERNYMDIQPGEVWSTWANGELLKNLTGYSPNTNIRDGVKEFVNWYRDYYQV